MKLVVKTLAENHFEGTVDSIQLPLLDGQAGVLTKHCKMTSLLGDGLLIYRIGGLLYYFLIHKGVVQINHDDICVLAEEVFTKEQLNKREITQELEQASHDLSKRDYSRYAESMLREIVCRCKVQLSILEKRF